MQIPVSEKYTSGERLRRWRWNGHDCRGDLKDPKPLLKAMLDGVENSGATARSRSVEKFLPHGVTLVLVLSESHFVVSTWPEFGFASIDIAVCSDSVSIKQLTQPLLCLLAAGRADSDAQTTQMSSSRERLQKASQDDFKLTS